MNLSSLVKFTLLIMIQWRAFSRPSFPFVTLITLLLISVHTFHSVNTVFLCVYLYEFPLIYPRLYQSLSSRNVFISTLFVVIERDIMIILRIRNKTGYCSAEQELPPLRLIEPCTKY